MEYILQDIDIFDQLLADKFKDLILTEIDKFETEKVYEFTVSFHVDLINDLSMFDKFILPPSDKIIKRKKGDKKEKIYEVLDFQLNQLQKILEQNNIVLCSSTIRGDLLKNTSVIKIDIVEVKDRSEEKNIINGRKRNLSIVKTIMPSKPYTENLVAKLSSERLNKLYNMIINAIKNKRIMSEILEIEETEEDNLLFQAFVKEYGELWFAPKAREKELFDKLISKTTEVLEKYNKR